MKIYFEANEVCWNPVTFRYEANLDYINKLKCNSCGAPSKTQKCEYCGSDVRESLAGGWE